MNDIQFNNFLKITETYKLKKVPRNNSNHYLDSKDDIEYQRKETSAEHVYSCYKLADFFFVTENEFANVDKLRVYELLMYHDDIEIITGDVGISEREQRINKQTAEKLALPTLYSLYPSGINDKLLSKNKEFRKKQTEESKFANAIDKMDALVHELEYPQD